MDFGSVMNQVREGGEGTGVPSPTRAGWVGAAGNGISSGGRGPRVTSERGWGGAWLGAC